MTQTIRDLLENLYGKYDVDSIYESIQKMLKTTREKLGESEPRQPFSERDITLITYGNSLRRDNESPLKTLHQFSETYLNNLISTIHILPFHPYSSDDGFSVLDYEAVNPDLGTWEDIGQIAESFRLMADFVVNHMSAKSDWFQKFLVGDSEYKNLYLTMSPDTDLSGVTRPRTSPLLTPFMKEDEQQIHVWTTFSADQVDFDYQQPETMLRMINLLLQYVEKGSTVIRLDAIAYLWKIVGTSCIHLLETHHFVQLMRAVLDEVVPNVWLITETNVPHQENISYFGDGRNEAQLVYNFTLPPLLFYTMLHEDTRLFRKWVNTLTPISEATTFFNFTASHDGIGVRPLEGILSPDEILNLAEKVKEKGGKVSYKQNSDGTQSPYELNITYVNAIISSDASVETQAKQFMVSQAIMLALAGVPAIYIHSLLGSQNDTKAVEKLGYNRAINRTKLQLDEIEADLNDTSMFRGQVFEQYRHLIDVRRQSPYFSPLVSQKAVDVGNDNLFVLVREINENQRLIGIHNISGHPHEFDISKLSHGQPLHNLIKNQIVSESIIQIAPYDVYWLETLS